MRDWRLSVVYRGRIIKQRGEKISLCCDRLSNRCCFFTSCACPAADAAVSNTDANAVIAE